MASPARTATLALGALGLSLIPSVSRAQTGPFKFNTLSPCRVVDTREPNGPAGSCGANCGTPALNANSTRSFPIVGFCGVPAGAKAVAFNITIAQPTDLGDLRLFPANLTDPPLASVINFLTSDLALANGAIIPLGSSSGNDISVHTDMLPGSTGTVHLILDVTGYFAQ